MGTRCGDSAAGSTNAVAICGNTGLGKVTRLERSRRYLINGTACRIFLATSQGAI